MTLEEKQIEEDSDSDEELVDPEEQIKTMLIIKEIEYLLYYENHKTRSIERLLKQSNDETVEYFSTFSQKKKPLLLKYYKSKIKIILKNLLMLNKKDPELETYIFMIIDATQLLLLLEKIKISLPHEK